MALGDTALSALRLRSRRWAWPRRESLVGLAFLLPSLILLGIFVFYPLGYVVYLSLLKWDLITPASVVGLNNYAALFKDSYFLQAVQVTVAISAASVAITLPLLSPTLLFATIILIIQSFQTFSQVYVMTQGGPAGATTTLVYYLYEVAFQFFQIGKAGAISVLLLLFLVGITLVQLILARRWVHYEL